MAQIKRITVLGPTLGLDWRASPAHIDDRAAADVLNMQAISEDTLAKRYGLRVVGTNLPLQGTVLHLDQYYKTNGSQWPIAITHNHVYYYDMQTRTWVDITPADGMLATPEDMVTADIALDTFIFTNGVDPIKMWTGSGSVVDLPNTTFRARIIREFANRLFALHVIGEPQLVRWTVPGTFDDWSSVGSGYAYLVEGVDWIVGAEMLGSYLVIYKERSIVACSTTGSATMPFRFDVVDSGVGCPAPRSIVNLGNEHIFLGWDNIYAYRGGRQIEPIGDPVQRYMFEAITPQAIHKSCTVILEERNELWFLVPSYGSMEPNIAWVYNYLLKKWHKHSMPATALGYWEVEESYTFGTLDGTFGEQSARFGDRAFMSGSPLIVVGTSGGMVYQFDPTTLSDAGVPIAAYVETKQFSGEDPVRENRWVGLELHARGQRVVVEYRVDEGPWINAGAIALASVWNTYHVHFDVVGSTIQFRFSNAELASGFELRRFDIKYIPGKAR